MKFKLRCQLGRIIEKILEGILTGFAGLTRLTLPFDATNFFNNSENLLGSRILRITSTPFSPKFNIKPISFPVAVR